MRQKFLPCLVVGLCLIAAAASASDETYIQARLFIDSRDDAIALHGLSLDQIGQGEDYVDIVTHADELTAIRDLGIRTEVVIPDMTAFYQSRLDATKDMGGYKTLDEIYTALDAILAANTDIMAPRVSIGQTLEGRDIWAVKVSDNPMVDEDEPEILFTAAIHAREVITPELLLRFLQYISDRYGMWPDVTEIVDEREMWFVLVVNPDGYYHNEVIAPGGGGMWRKNRRDNGDGSWGIDLNRNFGYEWGHDDLGSDPTPSSETYRGTGPFSEPEIQVMRDFTEAHDFGMSVYFHSYSNLIIWAWGFQLEYTPDEDIFSQIGDTVRGMNDYMPSPGWALYRTNGGANDWGYGEQTTKNKSFSFTIEVGSSSDGFWPATARIADLCNENMAPSVFLARTAGDIYGLRRPGQPTLYVPDVVDSAAFDLTWTLDDTLNAPDRWELIEALAPTTITDGADNFDHWHTRGFTVSTDRYFSPPSSFYSGANNNLFNSITSNELYLVKPGDTLKFRTYYEIDWDFDYAYVEISTDGVTFDVIPGNITTDDDPFYYNRGHGITGYSWGWMDARFPLDDFVGQQILIRISYITNRYWIEEGIYVDDIEPVEIFTGETVLSSSLSDTTYSFVEKQTGTYYYRVRGQDDEGQWSYFSPVKQVNVVGNYVCVDGDGDGYGDPGNPGNVCSDDNCPSTYNPGQEDADNDGSGDLCDVCPYDADDDADGDGLCADVDNCPAIHNPGQDDTDADGLGDLCDACPYDPDNDIDSDGICGDVDNCPTISNSSQFDSDGDTYGDACDNCPDDPNPEQADGDSDNVGDLCDNCPDIENQSQANADGDEFGDACDACPLDADNDIDADGVCGDVDNCPVVYNPDQIDSDGDGVGDLCCCRLRGDVNHDGSPLIDIADLVYMTDFMFGGGPEAPCFEEADINADGNPIVDIADLVYMVDYMFTGGPEPDPCPY